MLLRCTKCPFLTLDQARLSDHLRNHPETGPGGPRIPCPGCDHTFSSRLTLASHLTHDHHVDTTELEQMLNLVDTLSSPPQTLPEVLHCSIPKSQRIYIKSVDVLRNPSFSSSTEEQHAPLSLPDPFSVTSDLPIDLVDLCDLTHEDDDQSVATVGHRQQKIYLRSVNELQDQAAHLFSEFDQFQAFQPFPIPTPPPPQSATPTPPIVCSPTSDEATAALEAMIYVEQQQQEHSVEAPNKNKIYIRNVQTLIRPEVSHELVAAAEPGNSAAYHLQHLQPLGDLEEEVQSLPPQKNNDIVVLDDLHEEPPEEEEEEDFVQAEQYVAQSSVAIDQAPLPPLANDEGALKVLELSHHAFQGLEHQQVTANSNFIAIFGSSECQESSSSPFYYKNPEESIAQLQPPATPDDDGQKEGRECRVETPPEIIQTTDLITLVPPTKHDEEDQPAAPTVDNIICLPDESEGEERCALPQMMPRIYVSNNLAEPLIAATPTVVPPKPPPPVKSRGRPKGGRNYAKEGTRAFPYACPESGCPRRFREEATLEYHQRCHDQQQQPEGICCPECGSREFGQWNLLHSHLWRVHSIDMELYSCALCPFKTPCLSRLNNTHARTHSTEKEFPCDACPSKFKNQKQLKNHRRNHRLSLLRKAEARAPVEEEDKERHDDLFKCQNCDSKFEKEILLRKHILKQHWPPPSTRRKAKQRVRPTSEAAICHEKMSFKCDQCPYETMHRNSSRRHRMMHNGEKKYKCPVCDYSCIQSNSFRVHLLKTHPEQANDLIFRCPSCVFTTINKAQLSLHVRSKHVT